MTEEPRGQIHIRPTLRADAPAYREAVNAVAAEKWFLGTVDGFSLDQTEAFLERVVAESLPQVMARVDDTIVGFCDIIPNGVTGFGHVGRLGMGVRAQWRRRGIGRDMLAACQVLARNFGIEKVELEVYSDNVGALKLYESFGYTKEGLKVRSRKLDGRYQDVQLMALWL